MTHGLLRSCTIIELSVPFSNISNKHEPNAPFFCSCSSRTELFRTYACSVRIEHEQNRGSVRFCNFRTMPMFCSASNRTNRTNSNLHCSVSHLWHGGLDRDEVAWRRLYRECWTEDIKRKTKIVYDLNSILWCTMMLINVYWY